jgi:hypothetical protein
LPANQVNFSTGRSEIGDEKLQAVPPKMPFGGSLTQLPVAQVQWLVLAAKPGADATQERYCHKRVALIAILAFV